jgi:TetR/AcrR family transcriptional regulator, fatty acid metabolism regulator protein
LRSRVAWTTKNDVPGPGRRTHLRRDERRDQILDCALAVFARQGFHETSIADICAPARIARGTLYQYFTDKRDVLAALIDRIVGRVLAAAQQWPRFEVPPDMQWTAEHNIAFVEGRCLQIMSVVFADADTASLILRMARGTGFAREALARIDAQVVSVIAADVRAAMEQGAVRAFDPQIVAEFIVGGIEKIVIRALDEGRTIDVTRIARDIAVLVSSGLVPGNHGSPPRSRGPGGPRGRA